MKRRMLPLNALRAFESAARHGSFSLAADELGVTHGAISQQIKRLEDLLEAGLFIRSNRGVRLTEAGQTLFPVLLDGFDRMASALTGLRPAAGGNVMTLTATPTFAAKWLVPRLGRWRQSAPATAIHLRPSLRFLDIAKAEADLGVRCGLPPWPGLSAELLLPIHMTPLCSPALTPPGDPSALLDYTLLHADVAGHELGEEWRAWLAAAGLGQRQDLPGLSFEDPGLALQAAIDGLGVAMGYLELATADLAAGRLVQPFELALRHHFSYYLVYATARAEDPEITAFRKWITAQAGDDEPGGLR